MSDSIESLRKELDRQNSLLGKIQAKHSAAGRLHELAYFSNPVGLITFDREGNIRMINVRAAALLGHRPDALIRTSFTIFLREDSRLAFFKALNQTFAHPSSRTCQLQLQRMDGSLFWAQLKMNLISDTHNGQLLCQGVLVNWDDQKQLQTSYEEAQTRAENAEKALNFFLSAIGHELRSPLTSIIGFTHILREETDPNNRTHIESIRRSAERLKDSLDTLMLLTRFENEISPVKLKPVSIEEIAGDVVAMLIPRTKSRKLRFEYHCPSPSPWVMTDAGCLHQILHLLLSFAIRSTSSGGIQLSIGSEENRGRIQIIATSPALPSPLLDQFMSWLEVHHAHLLSIPEGLPPDLAITGMLIHRIQGLISIESTPQSWTSLTVSFPLAIPRVAAPVHQHDDDSSLPPIKERRLLVINPTAEIADQVQLTLGPEFVVDKATCTSEALDQLLEHPYHLVLMEIPDIRPGTDMNLLNAMRSLHDHASTPVIAMTEHFLSQDDIKRAGFNGYLPKPVKNDALVEIISSVLNPNF